MESGVLLEYMTHQLRELSKHRAGHRPGRIEPRVLKRRNNAYYKVNQITFIPSDAPALLCVPCVTLCELCG